MNYAFRHRTGEVAPHLNIKSSIFSEMEYLIGGVATTYHMHMEKDTNLGRGKKRFPLQLIILAGIKMLVWERNVFLSLTVFCFDNDQSQL